MAASPAPSASPTLRVMRLYKPKLYVDKRGGAPGATRLTSALVLPDSFGNIYKGETFFAYVSVLNAEDAPSPTLLDVAVSAKLQAPCAKRAVELKDTSERRRAEARADGVDPDSWRSPDMPPTRRRANPAAELRAGGFSSFTQKVADEQSHHDYAIKPNQLGAKLKKEGDVTTFALDFCRPISALVAVGAALSAFEAEA